MFLFCLAYFVTANQQPANREDICPGCEENDQQCFDECMAASRDDTGFTGTGFTGTGFTGTAGDPCMDCWGTCDDDTEDCESVCGPREAIQ